MHWFFALKEVKRSQQKKSGYFQDEDLEKYLKLLHKPL